MLRLSGFSKGSESNQTPVYELNPYTNVDDLVRAIEKFSQSSSGRNRHIYVRTNAMESAAF